MTKPLDIRLATIVDVDAISNIHLRSWRETYQHLMPIDYIESITLESRQQMWRTIIEQNLATVWLAEFNQTAVGFMCVGQPGPFKGSSSYQLSALYLLSEYHGHGIGKRMYQQAESYVAACQGQRLSLWVLDSNSKAIGFYQSCGLVVSGDEKIEHLECSQLRDIAMVKDFSLGK